MATATKTPVKTPATTTVKATAKKATAKKAPAKKAVVTVVAKTVTPVAPKAVVPPKAGRPDKAPKVKAKLVRDSFTMPATDFELIAQLKDKALGFKRPTKKSELLRASLQVLNGLSEARLKAALEALAPLKSGRPKNVTP